ncbi:hypothetical protein FCI58_03435, partial [Enterobacter hormaechei]|nr:hypothetical protein [Enterobacter hormaechei]
MRRRALRQRLAPADRVGNFLANHNSGGVQVAGDDLRHDRRIHHAQPFHPCGTCKMGYDEMAVVDGEGRV